MGTCLRRRARCRGAGGSCALLPALRGPGAGADDRLPAAQPGPGRAAGRQHGRGMVVPGCFTGVCRVQLQKMTFVNGVGVHCPQPPAAPAWTWPRCRAATWPNCARCRLQCSLLIARGGQDAGDVPSPACTPVWSSCGQLALLEGRARVQRQLSAALVDLPPVRRRRHWHGSSGSQVVSVRPCSRPCACFVALVTAGDAPCCQCAPATQWLNEAHSSYLRLALPHTRLARRPRSPKPTL